MAYGSVKVDSIVTSTKTVTVDNLATTTDLTSYLTTTTAGTTYAPLASPTFTGTATSPSITVTGSTAPTNGVYLSAANRLALATNSSGKLFINNVGQVGFSDESFNHDYSFYQSSNTTLRIANSSSTTASNRGALVYLAGSDLSIANQEAGFLRLFTNGTERLRITSAGRIGFGQTTPATTVDVNGAHSANVTAVAALNIDCSLGNLFTKTINGNSTFTVSNVPASRSYAFTLELTHTSGTITWFSGVVWPGGTAPTLTTGKVHLFMFFTDDGGTTWRASSLTNY